MPEYRGLTAFVLIGHVMRASSRRKWVAWAPIWEPVVYPSGSIMTRNSSRPRICSTSLGRADRGSVQLAVR